MPRKRRNVLRGNEIVHGQKNKIENSHTEDISNLIGITSYTNEIVTYETNNLSKMFSEQDIDSLVISDIKLEKADDDFMEFIELPIDTLQNNEENSIKSEVSIKDIKNEEEAKSNCFEKDLSIYQKATLTSDRVMRKRKHNILLKDFSLEEKWKRKKTNKKQLSNAYNRVLPKNGHKKALSSEELIRRQQQFLQSKVNEIESQKQKFQPPILSKNYADTSTIHKEKNSFKERHNCHLFSQVVCNDHGYDFKHRSYSGVMNQRLIQAIKKGTDIYSIEEIDYECSNYGVIFEDEHETKQKSNEKVQNNEEKNNIFKSQSIRTIIEKNKNANINESVQSSLIYNNEKIENANSSIGELSNIEQKLSDIVNRNNCNNEKKQLDSKSAPQDTAKVNGNLKNTESAINQEIFYNSKSGNSHTSFNNFVQNLEVDGENTDESNGKSDQTTSKYLRMECDEEIKDDSNHSCSLNSFNKHSLKQYNENNADIHNEDNCVNVKEKIVQVINENSSAENDEKFNQEKTQNNTNKISFQNILNKSPKNIINIKNNGDNNNKDNSRQFIIKFKDKSTNDQADPIPKTLRLINDPKISSNQDLMANINNKDNKNGSSTQQINIPKTVANTNKFNLIRPVKEQPIIPYVPPKEIMFGREFDNYKNSKMNNQNYTRVLKSLTIEETVTLAELLRKHNSKFCSDSIEEVKTTTTPAPLHPNIKDGSHNLGDIGIKEFQVSFPVGDRFDSQKLFIPIIKVPLHRLPDDLANLPNDINARITEPCEEKMIIGSSTPALIDKNSSIDNSKNMAILGPSVTERMYSKLTAEQIAELQRQEKPWTEQQIQQMAVYYINELRGKKRSEIKKIRCKICPNKEFSALATLLYHYRSHAGIKPFVCLICGFTFTRQHSLYYHMLIHRNLNRFKCKECKKMFRHPSHYKEHLRKHTGETPFVCDVCGSRFKTRNTYKRHMQLKHDKRIRGRFSTKTNNFDQSQRLSSSAVNEEDMAEVEACVDEEFKVYINKDGRLQSKGRDFLKPTKDDFPSISDKEILEVDEAFTFNRRPIVIEPDNSDENVDVKVEFVSAKQEIEKNFEIKDVDNNLIKPKTTIMKSLLRKDNSLKGPIVLKPDINALPKLRSNLNTNTNSLETNDRVVVIDSDSENEQNNNKIILRAENVDRVLSLNDLKSRQRNNNKPYIYLGARERGLNHTILPDASFLNKAPYDTRKPGHDSLFNHSRPKTSNVYDYNSLRNVKIFNAPRRNVSIISKISRDANDKVSK